MRERSGRAEFIERAECTERVIRMLQEHSRRESEIEGELEDTDNTRSYRKFMVSDVPVREK